MSGSGWSGLNAGGMTLANRYAGKRRRLKKDKEQLKEELLRKSIGIGRESIIISPNRLVKELVATIGNRLVTATRSNCHDC